MCDGPSVDNTASRQAERDAREARAREEARNQRIEQGRERINRLFDRGEIFDGGMVDNPAWQEWDERRGNAPPPLLGTAGAFDEPEPAKQIMQGTYRPGARAFDASYFDGIRQASLDYYTPELQRQFQGAKDTIAFDLARRGTTRSTEAGRQQGLLGEQFQVQAGNVARMANEAENNQRAAVEDRRARLITQLESTSDAAGAANAALAQSRFLQQPQVQYSPLGDVFAGLLSAGSSVLAGRQDARINQALTGVGVPANPRQAQASRVVG